MHVPVLSYTEAEISAAFAKLADPTATLTEADRQLLTEVTVTGLHDFVNPALAKWRKSGDARACEWKGHGWFIYDLAGNEYLDCLGGYGVFNFGHLHPRIVAAVENGLHRMGIHSQELLNPWQARFAMRFAQFSPGALQYVFFSNSGTESVEAALKIAMMKTGKQKFIGTINGYHGKTLGALSVTFRDIFRKPFEPLRDNVAVPFNDAAALEAAITPEIAAFIVEPVQGEAGIIVPDDSYFPAVRDICDKHGILLILDEVQTGMGRTGRYFASEHWGIAPDLMSVGKSVGGGVIPMGITTGTPAVWEALEPNPFMHSNTFGGNPIACAAGLAALEVLEEEQLAAKAESTGNFTTDRLRTLQAEFPTILREVRGKGLLIGVEFHEAEMGKAAAKELFNRHVLVAHTLNNPRAMRIEPPLATPEDVMAEMLDRFRTVLQGLAG